MGGLEASGGCHRTNVEVGRLMADVSGPLRVEVDGEVFEIAEHPGRSGAYTYAWISGPNQGYGFGSQSSKGSRSTMADHQESIWDFLRQVEPKTGLIE
jgi:hypothetical protein